MSITSLRCPGYAEGRDGRTLIMQPKSPEPVLLQEIGTDINVRCHALIDGICTAGVGKKTDQKEFELKIGEKGKQRPCYWLSQKA